MSKMLHQVVFQMNADTYKRYNLISWEDALFVCEAAKGFKYPVVWWSRGGPNQPWSLRQMHRVTSKEVKAEGSPFSRREPAPGEVGTLMGLSPDGGPTTGRSASGRSLPSSGETGPGLEKP